MDGVFAGARNIPDIGVVFGAGEISAIVAVASVFILAVGDVGFRIVICVHCE